MAPAKFQWSSNTLIKNRALILSHCTDLGQICNGVVFRSILCEEWACQLVYSYVYSNFSYKLQFVGFFIAILLLPMLHFLQLNEAKVTYKIKNYTCWPLNILNFENVFHCLFVYCSIVGFVHCLINPLHYSATSHIGLCYYDVMVLWLINDTRKALKPFWSACMVMHVDVWLCPVTLSNVPQFQSKWSYCRQYLCLVLHGNHSQWTNTQLCTSNVHERVPTRHSNSCLQVPRFVWK